MATSTGSGATQTPTAGSEAAPAAPPTIGLDDVFTFEFQNGQPFWGILDPSIPLCESSSPNYEPFMILKQLAPFEARDVVVLVGLEQVDVIVQEIARLLLKVRGRGR